MGCKPPFAGVTKTGKDWNLNYVEFVAVFPLLRPIHDHVPNRGSADGEPLFVGVTRRSEDWNDGLE
jgi:hypothetical protein